jgi:hypothetical protein
MGPALIWKLRYTSRARRRDDVTLGAGALAAGVPSCREVLLQVGPVAEL